MNIPSINGLQQIAEPISPLHGSDDELTLLDGNVDGRTCGDLRLDGE